MLKRWKVFSLCLSVMALFALAGCSYLDKDEKNASQTKKETAAESKIGLLRGLS